MRRLILYLLCCLLSTAASSRNEGFSIAEISDSVFARMKGRSFPEGCSIPREELRYLRLLYIDAKGNTHQGEMVCHQSIAADLVEIFRELYLKKYPIERMRLIDDYDADDERSMRANNTSCFCFRVIAGSTRLSKHARGLAVDVNTLYNPCVRRRKDGTLLVQPATGRPYANRQKAFPYKIEKHDLLYRLFTAHGFKWGGNWKSCQDYQHFEK